ncbi:hypothetical protein RvY_17355 [Ramazzottius varieornatus]|uniref:Uncharacterized protein n=1 Tax=Ramazzottius varieornatus TaxID=947166 RepID=A0A1D1W1U7_RAMVA|nr:hypothetical protein RvY_17355 [Ramazzottius varieornatus]
MAVLTKVIGGLNNVSPKDLSTFSDNLYEDAKEFIARYEGFLGVYGWDKPMKQKYVGFRMLEQTAGDKPHEVYIKLEKFYDRDEFAQHIKDVGFFTDPKTEKLPLYSKMREDTLREDQHIAFLALKDVLISKNRRNKDNGVTQVVLRRSSLQQVQAFMSAAQGEYLRPMAELGDPAWGVETRNERCGTDDWRYDVDVWFVKDTTDHTRTKKGQKIGPETRCRIYKDEAFVSLSPDVLGKPTGWDDSFLEFMELFLST